MKSLYVATIPSLVITPAPLLQVTCEADDGYHVL